MNCKKSVLLKKTLTGHEFDNSNLVELHLQRISEDLICALQALGYSDKPIIGMAHEIVKTWRFLGVRLWDAETLDFVVRVFFINNQELDSEEKDTGFFLAVFAACFFCIDRALIHARRNKTSIAEMWLCAVQELRFSRLSSSFSLQKALAKSRAEAKLAKDTDGKQAAKRFVEDCWKDWQTSPERYKSQAKFAKDMLEKCPNLENQVSIENWCREWKKASLS